MKSPRILGTHPTFTSLLAAKIPRVTIFIRPDKTGSPTPRTTIGVNKTARRAILVSAAEGRSEPVMLHSGSAGSLPEREDDFVSPAVKWVAAAANWVLERV